ncbi:sigma-70 RNA polymerase sigma factor region 4 domain-containing protein [Nocardiopsis nanhaiensis]
MNSSLFSEIESHFAAIAPTHLTLSGQYVHPQLEKRTYSLYELRDVLLAGATTNRVRDAVWRHTIRAARHSQDWLVGALGLAVPMLRSAVRHASRGLDRADVADLEAEVVAAAIRQVRTVNADHAGQGYFLLCRVRRAALGERKRALAAAAHQARSRAQEEADFEAEPGAARSCEPVLDAAVRAGTLTESEAELIARTRLEGVSLVVLSTETGVGYKTLAKRRQRAEKRLAAALCPVPEHDRAGAVAATSPISPAYAHPSGEPVGRATSNPLWPLAS